MVDIKETLTSSIMPIAATYYEYYCNEYERDGTGYFKAYFADFEDAIIYFLYKMNEKIVSDEKVDPFGQMGVIPFFDSWPATVLEYKLIDKNIIIPRNYSEIQADLRHNIYRNDNTGTYYYKNEGRFRTICDKIADYESTHQPLPVENDCADLGGRIIVLKKEWYIDFYREGAFWTNDRGRS